MLAGLTPVWVRPETDAITGLPLGVAPESVAAALAAHPEASAVFVGDPSYVGTIGTCKVWRRRPTPMTCR